MTPLATARFCPNCGADLQGDPIPEGSLHFYNHDPSGELIDSAEEYAKVRDEVRDETTHFRRVIGIYSRELDRTVAWRCPDCGHEEARA